MASGRKGGHFGINRETYIPFFIAGTSGGGSHAGDQVI